MGFRDHGHRQAYFTNQARHAYHCSCGKTVHGNGGRAGHMDMHERRGDDHGWLTTSQWIERRARER